MAQKYYPSIKRIMDAFHVDQETASVARKIMDGTIIPYSQSRYAWDNVENINILHCPKTAAWVGQCCNAPSLHTVKMNMLDEMLGSYGVEFINLEPDNYRWPKGIEYLKKAEKICIDINDSTNLITCLSNLADAYEMQGDYKEAFKNYRECISQRFSINIV